MTYQVEFPDFPPETMPPIPEGWEDCSWHNDMCPFFGVGRLMVIVDYADPEKREFPVEESPYRFAVIVWDDPKASGFVSNDWADVVAFVAASPLSKEPRPY